LIIQKEQNSVVIANMIDWWSNWLSAIAAPKLPLVDIAATAPPLGEAVAGPENAL
jgi:hypothetical protein